MFALRLTAYYTGASARGCLFSILGIGTHVFYDFLMLLVIRFIGLVNAAIWFGSAVFLTVGAAPAFFSDDMKALLGNAYGAYSGALVQVMFKRYFVVQYVCGTIAVLHLLVQSVYQGKPLEKLMVILVAALLALNLAGGVWMQPKLKELHAIKYAKDTTPAKRDEATQSMRLWHGVSQTANLIALIGLFAYFWQTVNRPDITRFVSTTKFRE